MSGNARRPIAALASVALAALGVTCAAPNPAERVATPPTPPSVATAPSTATDVTVPLPSASPVESAAAAPSASASASTNASASAAPLVVSATKPGRVACETTECDARREVCCVDTERRSGRCVAAPAAADANPCAEEQSPWRCDENADCGSGQTCCESYACTGGCPMEHVCEAGLCSATNTELCVPGAACRAGFHCVVEPGARIGSCALDRRDIPCGKKTCGGGDRCCWSKQSKKAACQATCEDVEDVVTLTCVSPEQCGGYACANFMMPGRPGGITLACMAASFAGDRAGFILCRSKKDCPPYQGTPPTGCKEAFPDLPHGVKACVYQ